jgi:GT2 family glycosyltransferase
MARGDYIGILNSDDRYTPFRIDALTRLLASRSTAWGFAGVGFIDENGKPLAHGQQAAVDVLMRGQNSLDPDTPITIGFSYFNHAISTGNLFFTRAYWQRLGGFRNYRYVHDWDFCLRALERESPAILHEQAYEYRMHGANTIQESQDRSESETYQMFHAWKPVARGAASPDPIRARLLQGAWELAMLRTHQAYLVGRKRLIEMADQLLGCPAGVQ